MIQNLVYNKIPFDKDGKVTIENIVNLKAQMKKKKKRNRKSEKAKSELNGKEGTLSNTESLEFESKFESGNLQLAYQTAPNTYQLFLHNDTNTTGYTQWFFFRVSNGKRDQKVTFEIMNLLRKKTKYCYGIKIWIFSTKNNKINKTGWYHTNDRVEYSRNNLYRLQKGKRIFYSTLSFDYVFEYDDDEVYFANCIPYTYTDQMKDLNEYQKYENTKYPFFVRKTLCTTLAGNDVDYIIINNNNTSSTPGGEEKEGAVFFARQHPSETVGSYVMKGMIDFLLGNSDEAVYLRDNFIFKIIPMLNPDGVINGNTRTSFAGCDLNRRWLKPNEMLHPEIYNAKEMITKFADQRHIQCIVDFHGHFGAFDSFFYANHDKENFATCKFFPFLCSKISKFINIDKCKFTMPKSKIGTGRINLFNELKIENVYTLETSNFGCLNGDYANKYFNINTLLEIGRDICIGLLMINYHNNNKMGIDVMGSKFFTEVQKIESDFEQFCLVKKGLKEENKKKKKEDNEDGAQDKNEQEENEDKEDEEKVDEDGNEDDDCSESEPSVDNIDIEEIKQLLPLEKKKTKKSKKNKNLKKIRIFQFGSNSKETLNNGITRKIYQQEPSGSINQGSLNKSQINLPQLKTIINTNTPKQKKQPTQMPNMKSNSIALQPLPSAKQPSSANHNSSQEKNTNDSSNKESESNNTNRLILYDQNNSNNNSNNSPHNNYLLAVKVESETQTEEIYFKMHWSYFLGTCQILAAKIEAVEKKNNASIFAKATLNNFYMQNFSNYNKKKNKTYRKPIDYGGNSSNLNGANKLTNNNNISNINNNNLINYNGSKNNHKTQLNINLNFYSLANGTILVNKISNSHSTKNQNNNLLRSYNFISTNFNRIINQK